MALAAAGPLHLGEVRTTVLLWRPVAAEWSGRAGGAGAAVLAAARAALCSPGHRAPLPAPDPAAVAAVDEAGRRLNAALRDRYARGEGAGDIAAAAMAVRAAAGALGGPMEGRPAVLCVGRADRLVKLRCGAALREAMGEAAALWSMSLGGWVRDAVAAAAGEHSARTPSAVTVAGRQALGGRLVGLLVQAEIVAATAGEAAAVRLAGDAVAAAAERLRGGGAGSSRWADSGRRRRRRPWEGDG